MPLADARRSAAVRRCELPPGDPGACVGRALVATALLLVAPLLAACWREPPEVETMRRGTGRALTRLETRDPAAATELESLIAAAERLATARADPETLVEAWNRAESFASEALRRSEPPGDQDLEWSRAEAEARRRLAAVRRELAQAGLERQASLELTRAELRLEVARRQAAAGRLGVAIEEAGAAIAHLVDASRLGEARLARLRDAGNIIRWQNLVGSVLENTSRRAEVVVVDKLKRRLRVFRGGRVISSYTVELGTNGLAPKRREGDAATPEGVYRVTRKKSGGETRFYKALLLDYPNREDRRRFEALRSSGRLPAGARIGGLIEIHGDGGVGRDWTDGCIALVNRDMDALYRQVAQGTRVVIVGTY